MGFELWAYIIVLAVFTVILFTLFRWCSMEGDKCDCEKDRFMYSSVPSVYGYYLAILVVGLVLLGLWYFSKLSCGRTSDIQFLVGYYMVTLLLLILVSFLIFDYRPRGKELIAAGLVFLALMIYAVPVCAN